MSVKLSEKHGVNPSVEQCFYCLKDVALILLGRLKGDAEAPRKSCRGPGFPCEECKEFMRQGIILISVDESKSEDIQNPYRTGGWCVIRDAAIERILWDPKQVEYVLKSRTAFVPDHVWDKLGLPRGT